MTENFAGFIPRANQQLRKVILRKNTTRGSDVGLVYAAHITHLITMEDRHENCNADRVLLHISL